MSGRDGKGRREHRPPLPGDAKRSGGLGVSRIQGGDDFELVGRAAGTEARGCSIAVDELILAARSQA